MVHSNSIFLLEFFLVSHAAFELSVYLSCPIDRSIDDADAAADAAADDADAAADDADAADMLLLLLLLMMMMMMMMLMMQR